MYEERDRRIAKLDIELRRREVPFHWQVSNLSTFLYDGDEHRVNYQNVCEITDEEIRALYSSGDEDTQFWNKAVGSLSEGLVDSDMIAFHDWVIKDNSFIVRYADLT
jgi:hypothetical protein